MWWWKVALGVLIVGFAVRELFQDLFHPTQSGALSEQVGHGLFVTLRRWPSVLASSGPLTVLIVIFLWALLLVVGFALIYWAAFPDNFALKTVNKPNGHDEFWWCFYYSLEMLTTLGLGDIEPVPNWLRILSAMHTLVGFSLVTASITWIVLLFPALRRMRTLARKAHILDAASNETGVPVAGSGMHVIIAGLAEEVIQTRVDLIHFPILFYFYSQEQAASIATAVFPLLRFAEEGSRPEQDDLLRLTSNALRRALDDLAERIGKRLGCDKGTTEDKFRALARFHLKPVPEIPAR